MINFPNGINITGSSQASADLVSSASINALNMNTQNYIINGNFDVWQRGTSFPTISSSQYLSDRWRWGNTAATAVTVTRDSDVPIIGSTFYGSSYSIKIDCTTVASGTDNVSVLSQFIEGNVYKHLHGKQVTLSFWIKSTKTGTSTVSFRNSVNNRSYVAPYTINASDTWEKKIITLTLDNSGTWLFDNGIGMRVDFVLYKFEGYAEATANTWTDTSIRYGVSGQTNLLDNTANNIFISQVQLELGSQATPFKPFGGSFISDLMACYRYYSTSGSFDSVVPVNNGTGASVSFVSRALNSGNCRSTTFFFPVQMRAIPSVTVWDIAATPNVGKINFADAGGSAANNVNEAATKIITTTGWRYDSGGVGSTSDGAGLLQYTASSEL
jgi:hypothetical protein